MKASEAKLDTPVLASRHLAIAGAVCKVSFPRWQRRLADEHSVALQCRGEATTALYAFVLKGVAPCL
jgi:hypothetical protein